MYYGHNFNILLRRALRRLSDGEFASGHMESGLPFLTYSLTFSDKEIRSVTDKTRPTSPEDKEKLITDIGKYMQDALNDSGEPQFDVISHTEHKNDAMQVAFRIQLNEDSAHAFELLKSNSEFVNYLRGRTLTGRLFKQADRLIVEQNPFIH